MISINTTIVCFITVVVLFFPSLTLAHTIKIIAFQENDIVYCEGLYQDGKPVIDGVFTVTSQGGTNITSGKMNVNGVFKFPYSGDQKLIIKLKTSMGHASSIVFKGQDKSELKAVSETYSKPDFIKVLQGIAIIFSLFAIAAYLLSKNK